MEPFDDADLVSHILRMVPKHWQDQYKLTGSTVPLSVHKLFAALEQMEKAFLTEKEHKGPKASTMGGGSSKKRMVSFSNQISKKSCKEAIHCTLCKHDTGDCHKYEKDDTPKKAFAGKSAQQNLCNRVAPCEHNTNYGQLSEKIVKLEKSN